MNLLSVNNALQLFFLIAPALHLVNTIIAIAFVFKYKADPIYKKNASIWFFYLTVAASQGALQDTDINILVKTLIWSISIFLVIESMALFAADVFKIKSNIKSDITLFAIGFVLTSMLSHIIDNFFLISLPVVFFSAYPVLRLIPLTINLKNYSFTKSGYLICALITALHVVDYSYMVDKPEYLFHGYLFALMLMTGTSCFAYAILIERAIMEVEIKDLLQNTSRLTALGGMAAEIAHEIKNPLTVLALCNYQIKQKIEIGQVDDIFIKAKLDVYERMTQRLIAIMDSLKVNYQSGDLDDLISVPIKNIFEDIRILCDLRARKFKINLIFENINNYDVMILCRSVQITQVLQNLIHNAVDVLESSNEKWIKIGVELNGGSVVEITVTDSGPGIPEMIRHKIFDTLFTTKTNGKGTGLGLSISKRFAEEHNGYLMLDKTSKNTKFIFGLPIHIGLESKINKAS